jgi:hypothetical protein
MADEAQAVSRAAQEALARLPMPAAPDVLNGPALVPAALRNQADAARAFLKRWLAEGASGNLASAIGVVVSALQ